MVEIFNKLFVFLCLPIIFSFLLESFYITVQQKLIFCSATYQHELSLNVICISIYLYSFRVCGVPHAYHVTCFVASGKCVEGLAALLDIDQNSTCFHFWKYSKCWLHAMPLIHYWNKYIFLYLWKRYNKIVLHLNIIL